MAGLSGGLVLKCLFTCRPTGTRKRPSRHGAEHAQVHAAEASDPSAANAAAPTTAFGGTGAEIKTLDGTREIP